MSDAKTCPRCKAENQSNRFCSQCGLDLEHEFIERVQPAYVNAPPAQSYGALRFMAGVMIFFGWAMIIGSVILGCLFLGAMAGTGAIVSQEGNVPFAFMGGVTQLVGQFGGVFLIVFGVMAGIAQIASGQFFLAFLDMRDDVRKIANQK